MKNIATFGLLSVALVTVSACGGRSDGDEGGYLPDEDTMYLPTPEDTATSGRGLTATDSSGLCASDSRAFNELKAIVEEHNDEIKAHIDLLKSLKRQAVRQLERNGSFERTVTGSGGRSLTFVATIEADGSISYQATFNGPSVQSYQFLTGTTAADRASGAWTFYKINGTAAINVTWTKTEAALDVTRTVVATGASVNYHREGDVASVTVMGPNKSAMIVWSVSTKAGSISVNGETKLCWNAELCTETCSEN